SIQVYGKIKYANNEHFIATELFIAHSSEDEEFLEIIVKGARLAEIYSDLCLESFSSFKIS
ncbi:hypothetical protein ACJX0J_015231, partial [Zea mays]